MGVLEQLFRGKINHTDWTPESEEYRKRLKRSGDIGSALKTGMTEEQNNMFEQYVDARLATESIIHEDLFRRAFLLGVQMQRESGLLSDKKED